MRVWVRFTFGLFFTRQASSKTVKIHPVGDHAASYIQRGWHFIYLGHNLDSPRSIFLVAHTYEHATHFNIGTVWSFPRMSRLVHTIHLSSWYLEHSMLQAICWISSTHGHTISWFYIVLSCIQSDSYKIRSFFRFIFTNHNHQIPFPLKVFCTCLITLIKNPPTDFNQPPWKMNYTLLFIFEPTQIFQSLPTKSLLTPKY